MPCIKRGNPCKISKKCHNVTVSQLFENAFQPIKKIYNYIYNYNYSIGVFYQFQKTVIL